MDGHGFIVAGAGGGFGQPPPDGPTCDTSERVIICPTALLMMLDHFNNIVEIMQFIVVGFVCILNAWNFVIGLLECKLFSWLFFELS